MLHITDTLETADARGLALRPKRPDEPVLKPDPAAVRRGYPAFDPMIERWFPLAYVLGRRWKAGCRCHSGRQSWPR